MSDEYIIVVCPHCQDHIIILKKQLRCRIFRHAVYISTGKGVHPHSSQKVCEDLVKRGKVYGCGKPFYVNEAGNAEICEYTFRGV